MYNIHRVKASSYAIFMLVLNMVITVESSGYLEVTSVEKSDLFTSTSLQAQVVMCFVRTVNGNIEYNGLVYDQQVL